MGIVKIITGKYKGQKIATPGEGTHPMGERERLALFNMIMEFLPGAKVLDAYAGSGALGIEALSRGASLVVFIDKSRAAIRTISRTCTRLGITDGQAVFYRGTMNMFIKSVSQNTGESLVAESLASLGKVDVILADPPYDNFRAVEVGMLADGCLRDGGILVLSHPGVAPALKGLSLEKSRKYAGATISVYRRG